MNFGSLFAGIRGFDEGLRRAGFDQVYAAEIDKKCNSIAKRHFPDERTVECVTAVSGSGFRTDILTAGWPCQGNSVAGRRAGMADQRSGLWSEVARVLAEQRPQWFLGENVPGILSVNGGRDWLAVLRDLEKLGYGFAYRILDSQWFGVAQRRRRVFLVGWRSAAEVLFERESLPWNPPPSREAGSEPSRELATGTNPHRYDGDTENFITGALQSRTQEAGEGIIPFDTTQITSQDNRSNPKGGDPCHPIPAEGHPPAIAIQERSVSETGGPGGKGWRDDNVGYTLESRQVPQSVLAFQTRIGRNDRGQPEEVCPTLQGANAGATSDMRPCVQSGMAVRRLTPRECERLQGFPDEWTRYDEHGNEIADGPRYRMLGNAVTVDVIEWIGKRIKTVQERKL